MAWLFSTKKALVQPGGVKPNSFHYEKFTPNVIAKAA